MTFNITTVSVEKANSTLNKTIKMRYDTQVYNYTPMAKTIGMPQE